MQYSMYRKTTELSIEIGGVEMSSAKRIAVLVVALVSWGRCPPGLAQIRHIHVRPPAANVLVPQSQALAFTPQRREAIAITDVHVRIDIVETVATTTIEMRLVNKTNRRQEAELVVPVPDGAVVRGFAYDGPNGGITAEVLPRDEAKRIY